MKTNIKIFVDYKEPGLTRVHENESFNEQLDVEQQLIEVSKKYEGKPDLNISVRYLNTWTKTWSELYSYYPSDKKFVKH